MDCGRTPDDLQEAEALVMALVQLRAPRHREAPSQSQGRMESRAFTLHGPLEVPRVGSWASSIMRNLLGMQILGPSPRRPESGTLRVGPAFWGLTSPVNQRRPSQQAAAAERLLQQSSAQAFGQVRPPAEAGGRAEQGQD